MRNIELARMEHHGIVLDASSNKFDRGSVAFASLFTSEDIPSKVFLFYSGAQDAQWSHSAIGLAVSSDAFRFQKIADSPILEGTPQSFCFKEALAPSVIRVRNRFYMIFSGRPSHKASRRVGIAYADDLEGPWHIIGEIMKPTSLWEGVHIDNGPSLVKLDETTFLIYYSNVTAWKAYDISAVLRRYPIRKIGIAKMRIRGPSISQIEVQNLTVNPLKHLNGKKGAWNESLFCPGYFQYDGAHHLLPATSTYSTGFPYRQCIGIASSNTPYFHESNTRVQKLIDGPIEKRLIIPNIKSEIALDYASPLLDREENRLYLYYSVADYADYRWKIALTTFDFG